MNKVKKSVLVFEKLEPEICIQAKKRMIIYPMEIAILNESCECRCIQPKTISHYIKFFTLIPDLVLEYSGLKISAKDEPGLIEMLLTYREIYKGIALWMSRMLEGIIDSRIYSSPLKHYEPLAIQRIELLKLIQSLYDKKYSDSLKNMLKTPTENSVLFNAGEEVSVWFSCEFWDLKNHFEKNGILGKPIKEGRRSAADKLIKIYSEKIENYYQRKICVFHDEIDDKNNLHGGREIIEALAEVIAQQDDNFYQIYTKYCKTQKRVYRTIRNSPVARAFYLDEGLVKEVKRGKSKK